MTTFRKPDIELPRWIDIRICDQPGMQPLHLINIRDPADVTARIEREKGK